ncbi:MAG: hypothetical protein WD740_05535 [Anaerolineales bacterium]
MICLASDPKTEVELAKEYPELTDYTPLQLIDNEGVLPEEAKNPGELLLSLYPKPQWRLTHLVHMLYNRRLALCRSLPCKSGFSSFFVSTC